MTLKSYALDLGWFGGVRVLGIKNITIPNPLRDGEIPEITCPQFYGETQVTFPKQLIPRQFWEVPNGVGVDGFGGFFPILTFFFFVPRGQGQTTAIYCKDGEFHSDPVCTDPVQNFPKFLGSDMLLLFIVILDVRELGRHLESADD